MNLYASSTSVSVEKTKAELERLLARHGAKRYGIAHAEDGAQVSFVMSEMHVRLEVPLPSLAAYPDPAKADWQTDLKTPRDWYRWSVANRRAWVEKERDQVVRQRWRCILLIVRAKLELIEMELSTVEREFLADITLNDGRTVLEAYGSRLLTP